MTFKAKGFLSAAEKAVSKAGKPYTRHWFTLYQDNRANTKHMVFVRDGAPELAPGNYYCDMYIEDGQVGARPVFTNFVKSK